MLQLVCCYFFLQVSDKDIGENVEVVFEIIDGNEKQLFWINFLSGDLFFVVLIIFIVGDVVVFVVEVCDVFIINVL